MRTIYPLGRIGTSIAPKSSMTALLQQSYQSAACLGCQLDLLAPSQGKVQGDCTPDVARPDDRYLGLPCHTDPPLVPYLHQ